MPTITDRELDALEATASEAAADDAAHRSMRNTIWFDNARIGRLLARDRPMHEAVTKLVKEVRAMRPVVEALDRHERHYQTASGLKNVIQAYRKHEED